MQVFEFMLRHSMMWRKTGRTRSAETCLTALNSFKRFRKHADLGYDEVTSDLVQRYESYLKEQGLCRNTSSFYIRQFRTCYNLAVEQGLTADRHPFRHVYTGVDKTAKRALRQEDMSRIYRMDLSGLPQAAFARDIFMFSFFTRGMSFVDMAYLKKSDVSDSTLTYRRRKTGQTLSVGWEQQMQAIVDRYATEKATSYLLPLITREDGTERTQYESKMQQVNRHLKKIGQELGLPIPLTTYCARHSWATIARDRNVPLAVISEALGHDNEQTTRIYLDSIRTSVVDDANRMIIEGL